MQAIKAGDKAEEEAIYIRCSIVVKSCILCTLMLRWSGCDSCLLHTVHEEVGGAFLLLLLLCTHARV